MGCDMKLPSLTPLQEIILGIIGGSTEVPGKAIRSDLLGFNIKLSKPSFYQAMARLELAGFVKGSYFQQIVDKQIIRERVYTATREGTAALMETMRYYRERCGC